MSGYNTAGGENSGSNLDGWALSVYGMTFEDLNRAMGGMGGSQQEARANDSYAPDMDEQTENPLAGDVDGWQPQDPPATNADHVARQHGDLV